MSPHLQTALAMWAEEAGCREIDFEHSYEFRWLWVLCSFYALLVLLTILLPRCPFCKRRKAARSMVAAEGHTSSVPEDVGPKPNVEAARRHLRRTSPTDASGAWRPLLGSRLSDFNGTGLALYFQLLRLLGSVFAVMSAITSPLVALSLQGNFVPDTGQMLARASIGNLAQLPPNELPPAKRIILLNCQGWPLAEVTELLSWLDFAAVLVFLAALAFFRYRWLPQEVAKDDAERVTAPDFAVEVNNLPARLEEHARYEELLREHIIGLLRACGQRKEAAEPQIHEVVLVRDYNGRLGELEERARLVRSKAIAEFKGEEREAEKLGAELERITERLANNGALAAEEDLPVVRAYVILNTSFEKYCLIHEHRFAEYSFLRRFFLKALQFQGQVLRMTSAPEPTDIFWPNQDLKWKERVRRQALAWLVFLLLIIASLFCIYSASTAARRATPGSSSYLGHASCDPIAFVASSDPSSDSTSSGSEYRCEAINATRWTIGQARAQGEEAMRCFCATKGYSRVISKPALAQACMKWLAESASGAAIMSLATLAVVTINAVVEMALLAMAAYERPPSLSALSTSMMVKVAVAQTINTAVVVTLVNYAGSPELRETAGKVPLGSLLFRGNFGDATRGWYAMVGGAISLNMLVNAVAPGATSLLLAAFNSLWRCARARKIQHHEELLELYTNPHFDISGRFAQMLTTVFCTLAYCPGLPLLPLFAAFYMLVSYWSDKTVLLWGSQLPPAYNSQMARQASGAMLAAVALHCVAAVIMYSQPCTFPTAAAAVPSGSGVFYSFLVRGSQESTWMFLLLLLVMTWLWLLNCAAWILGGTCGGVTAVLSSYIGSSVMALPQSTPEGLTWREARCQIDATHPPASFRMEARPEYRELSQHLSASAGFAVLPYAAGKDKGLAAAELKVALDGQPSMATE